MGNSDLHGSAPDTHAIALLLIDVINPLDFPEADQLLRFAVPAAERIAALKRRAREAGVPVVYVNDNFGKWRSDFRQVYEEASGEASRGRPIAQLLRPDTEDYFVLKPKHSGFFSSTLELLLGKLGARELILTGFATDICVLFTANDAYMRDLSLVVPEDCCAANTAPAHRHALEVLRTLLKARTEPSDLLHFTASGCVRAPAPSGRG
jgi:nicotinamidase-related amidase